MVHSNQNRSSICVNGPILLIHMTDCWFRSYNTTLLSNDMYCFIYILGIIQIRTPHLHIFVSNCLLSYVLIIIINTIILILEWEGKIRFGSSIFVLSLHTLHIIIIITTTSYIWDDFFFRTSFKYVCVYENIPWLAVRILPARAKIVFCSCIDQCLRSLRIHIYYIIALYHIECPACYFFFSYRINPSAKQ